MATTEHNLYYYPYASFTNAQLPLLMVAALWFDKLVLLNPIGASWDAIGADHAARDAVRQIKDAGILENVTSATVLAKYNRPIADAIRRNMANYEFPGAEWLLDWRDGKKGLQENGLHRLIRT
jgi:hypothetical protein